MATLKLKVAKTAYYNPSNKKMGYTARVVTNGKSGYDDIVAEACRNTTLNKAEAKVAFDLCIEMVAEKVKQGYIVDLGPVGKIYPSCSSGWHESADELTIEEVKPTAYYRPSAEIESAVKGALLQWTKADEAAEGEDPDAGDTDSPVTPPLE